MVQVQVYKSESVVEAQVDGYQIQINGKNGELSTVIYGSYGQPVAKSKMTASDKGDAQSFTVISNDDEKRATIGYQFFETENQIEIVHGDEGISINVYGPRDEAIMEVYADWNELLDLGEYDSPKM